MGVLTYPRMDPNDITLSMRTTHQPSISVYFNTPYMSKVMRNPLKTIITRATQ